MASDDGSEERWHELFESAHDGVFLIDAMPDAAVVAHLDRDPLMLYPELAERGWAAQRVPAPPGEVRLRLTRDANGPHTRD